MSNYQLAQLNIGTLRASRESPLLADFIANLEPMYEIAERAPGFVWRPKESEDANLMAIFRDRVAANMSVWDGIESLRAFAFGPVHLQMLRRRPDWFERSEPMPI